MRILARQLYHSAGKRLTMPPSIILSGPETTFVSLLDDFAGRLEPPVECRIAGGWVRDKLLSLPSSDLDIALTIPSGHAFAVGFVDFLKSKKVPTGSIGKIAANPEQSKHLETGTTRIMDLECDFVGLRSESYADSRIPQIKPGSPLEDSCRRDLTINSLFYNVHSRQIEDFTGKGLSDLENRIARTPLAPRQTFEDDPLRIVRCIRFASRFNLTIDPEVVEAIQKDNVKAEILKKVSKERIGIEVTKMLHNNPFHALSLIDSLGLHPYVFNCEIDPPRQEAIAAAQILNHLASRDSIDEILWLATAMVPFRNLVIKRKGKTLPAIYGVIGEGLKLSTETRNSVTNLFEAVKILDPAATKRSAIGVSLQHQAVRPWERSLTWAIVMDILPSWRGHWDEEADAVVKKYEQFRERLYDLGLPESIDKPLLLDGNDIQKLLSIPPSSLMTVIRSFLNAWQLDNPEASRGDCEKWLKAKWEGDDREQWESAAQPHKKPTKRAKRSS